MLMRSGVQWRLSWIIAAWLFLSQGGYVVAQTGVDSGAALIQLVNQERAAAGLPGCNLEPTLQQVAQAQAAHMAATSTLTHAGADGSDLVARLRQVAYQGSGIEVLYAGSNGPEGVIAWWVNTEFNQTTLLNPIYHDIGVGQAAGADGWIYWSIILGSPTHRGVINAPPSPTLTSVPALSPTPTDAERDLAASATAVPPPTLTAVPTSSASPSLSLSAATLPPPTRTPWPATFTPAPTRTPTPAVEATTVIAQAAAAIGQTVNQAAAVALAPLPTPTQADAPPAAPAEALVSPQPTRFDPIPLLVALLALAGAAGLIYAGSRPTPRQRDPFRR